MCNCNFCQREAKFKDILSKYEFSEDDLEFLKEYQNNHVNVDFDRDIAEAKQESLIEVLKCLKNSGYFTAEQYWYIFNAKKVANDSLFLSEDFWEILK